MDPFLDPSGALCMCFEQAWDVALVQLLPDIGPPNSLCNPCSTPTVAQAVPSFVPY